MNPWVAEQLVESRMADLAAAAHGHRRPGTPDHEDVSTPSAPRTRPALARHMGVLLIAMGRRLADSDGLPPAFEGPHRP
jgi:hypothetical protein